jgi:hypothetical protein
VQSPAFRTALVASAALAVAALTSPALGATQISQLPGPNGTVNTISEPDSNGVRYIGGDFTMFNLWDTGGGAAFGQGTDLPDVDFPKVAGSVNAVAGDGSGGFYIGGEFTCIGALNGDADCTDTGEFVRNRLAHINADGSVDAAWDPSANNTVHAIAVSGSTVYIGGGFTAIGSGPTARNRIAAVSTATGAATDWNPNASNIVYAIALSGSTVYAGGAFTTIGGQSRSRIAALDATANTSNATAWNPGADMPVRALAVSGSTVYAGGDFYLLGGATHPNLGAVSTLSNTSNATAWNPSASGSVYALTLSGSTLYAGGQFTSIGGQSRNRIAALDTTLNTNNATSWNPNASTTVYAIGVSGSTVYAGGQFTTVGGQSRNRIAALDATTGNATAWNPSANTTVRAIASSGRTTYVGGEFSVVGGIARGRLAAIDADGYLTSWNPTASAGVKNILVDGSTVYVGGEFATLGGATRRGLAAVGTDGTLRDWNPGLNSGGSARDLVKVGTDLFFGGQFSAVGGVTRANAAAVSLAGSCATSFTDSCVKSWNPATTGVARGSEVNTLYQLGTTMLMGGPFSTVSAITRQGAAAVGIDSTCLESYTSACVQSWDPNFDERVNALEVLGDVAYMSGWFGTASGSSRTKLAAVKVDSPCITSWSSGSCLTAWNPTATNAVNALAISGTTLYAGGPFQTFAGTTRNRLASVDLSGACATTFSAPCLGSWDPNAGDEVGTVRAAGSNVFVGGAFTSLSGVSRFRFGVVGADGTLGAAIGGSRPAAPSAPVSLTATVSGQVATVVFTAGYNGNSPVLTYTATCTSSSGGTTRTGTAASPTVTVSDLTPGATYTCTASATNAISTGAASTASDPFTVAGVAPTPPAPDPATPGSSGSGSEAAAPPQAAQSSAPLPTQNPVVPRLRLSLPPAPSTGGRIVTTGVVPPGATSVVQIARSGRAAASLSRGPRAAARVATNCPITTAGTTRTFTCRTRLGTGAWTLTTEARAGSTVVASTSRRVVVKAARRTAVTG